MDRQKLSHDILNMIERLKIMHDLAKDKKFDVISKEELATDLEVTLKTIENNFKILIQ